jgi:hypothetical protein
MINDKYISPFVTDRMGFDFAFGYRFSIWDLSWHKEYIMEALLGEHWFDGIEH